MPPLWYLLCELCIREEVIDVVQENEQHTVSYVHRWAQNYSNVL